MKRYAIQRTTANFTYNSRLNIEKGCTLDDEYPELMSHYGTLEEAEKELFTLKSFARKINEYWFVAEYSIVEHEYNDEGEWINGGVWGITEMEIEVVDRETYDTIRIFDNMAEAEEFANNYAIENETDTYLTGF